MFVLFYLKCEVPVQKFFNWTLYSVLYIFFQVSGCLQLSGNELLNSITEYQFDSKFYINIQATFTEAFTGIKVKETARSPNLVRKSQSMSFVNVPSKFKPGFPLTFKVKSSVSSSCVTHFAEKWLISIRTNVYYNIN